jgi:polyphosphate kinase
MVLFNRSWYNRAGVEYVMKFCTRKECEAFLETVPRFEQMLVRSGIFLLKYYLDITRDEQARRLRDRRRDPLKQWKTSPVDQAAQSHWDDYSRARDTMLRRTHQPEAPWVIVRADDKHQARLNVIRDILAHIPAPGVARRHARSDSRVARAFSEALLASRWIAH